MELFAFALFVVLVVVTGILASKRGRNVFGWVVLSIFLSPVLGIILLLVLGPSEEKKMERIIWEEKLRKQIRGGIKQRFKINTYDVAEIRESVKNIREKNGPFVGKPIWYVNQRTYEKIEELARQQQFKFDNIDKDDTLPDDIVEMRLE